MQDDKAHKKEYTVQLLPHGGREWQAHRILVDYKACNVAGVKEELGCREGLLVHKAAVLPRVVEQVGGDAPVPINALVSDAFIKSLNRIKQINKQPNEERKEGKKEGVSK